MNEIIPDKKKIINEKIFWNYCKYENPSLLSKDLIKFRDNQAKREQLVNNMNNGLIDLSNAIDKKQLKSQIKKNNIVEKILDFDKQQKCR